MARISSSTRKQIRERANGRCEYCLKPDFVTRFGHHVDHIMALKQGGLSFLDNYAYACLKCNTSKGTNIAAYDDETGELIPLYNPRWQRWDDHFELQGIIVLGKTPVGRVTVYILDMNHPKQLEIRRELIDSGRW